MLNYFLYLTYRDKYCIESECIGIPRGKKEIWVIETRLYNVSFDVSIFAITFYTCSPCATNVLVVFQRWSSETFSTDHSGPVDTSHGYAAHPMGRDAFRSGESPEPRGKHVTGTAAPQNTSEFAWVSARWRDGYMHLCRTRRVTYRWSFSSSGLCSKGICYGVPAAVSELFGVLTRGRNWVCTRRTKPPFCFHTLARRAVQMRLFVFSTILKWKLYCE